MYRRILKSSGILMSGNMAEAALGFVSITLTARGLGLESFGIFALIQSFVRLVDGFVNFQSWQALIKYGSEALARGKTRDLARLVRFGFVLDAGTALLGALIAVAACWPLGRWYGLEHATILMASLYGATIAFNINGTPTAVLRLFGRFDRLAMQKLLAAAFRLAGILTVFLMDGNFWGYLAAWAVADVFGYIMLMVMGLFALRQQGVPVWKAAGTGKTARDFPGLWRFVWLSNLTGTMKLTDKELDLLIVGAMIGAPAAGIYKVAKLFSKALDQLVGAFDQVIYPDLAALWARSAISRLRRTVLHISLAGIAAGVVIWLFFLFQAPWIIRFTVGREFASAYTPLMVFLLSSIFWMGSLGFRSVLLSIGRIGTIFVIQLTAYLVYFLALPLLLLQMEVTGAALAKVLYQFMLGGAMLAVMRRHLFGEPIDAGRTGRVGRPSPE